MNIEIEIKDGNYLWDRNNCSLIKYQETGSIVIGSIKNDKNVNVAFPIPLDEDTLTALGFVCKNNAEFINTDIKKTIEIDVKNPKSILVIDQHPILYVSDLQNYLVSKNERLNICEEELIKACSKRVK